MIKIKALKLGREGMYLNIMKYIYDKHTVYILNTEKMKHFPLISGIRQKIPTLDSYIHYSIESLRAIRQDK